MRVAASGGGRLQAHRGSRISAEVLHGQALEKRVVVNKQATVARGPHQGQMFGLVAEKRLTGPLR